VKYLAIALLVSSCSPKAEQANLPNYSDMGAAADAGRIVTEGK
jgi:hypothetical protein